MNIYLCLLVSQGPALVWNYPKERFTFDRMKRKARSIHFCWGMKELRSFRVTAQSKHLSFLLRGNFSWDKLCSSLLTQESLSHFHVCDCVWFYVCVCACRCEHHHLNLHGNDVPVSQTPARIREGRRQGVNCLSKNWKKIRCWCTKRIKLTKNI